MGVSAEKIREIKTITKDLVSLDMPIGEDGESFLKDMIPDEESINPYEVAVGDALKETVGQAISSLSPREACVIKLRFGFNNGQIHTLDQIGTKLGITRERVRQIEARAIRKLRYPKRAEKLYNLMH